MEGLGGAGIHGSTSGVAHFVGDSEPETLASVRDLFRYIPQNNTEPAPRRETEDPVDRADEALLDVVPSNPNKPYDMKDVIGRVVDDGAFYEVHAAFAPNLITGFAHLGGHAVGVVANSRRCLRGCWISIVGQGRAIRALLRRLQHSAGGLRGRTGLPSGVGQEHGGIIRHGAKLLYAFAEATVPRVTVITRKAYGGAYDVMNSRHIRGDMSLAWPTAEIAVMGPKGAVEILFRKEIAKADDPGAALTERMEEYRERFAHPYIAAAPRVRRRRHRSARDPGPAGRRSRHPREQARRQPFPETRQHSALRRRRCSNRF